MRWKRLVVASVSLLLFIYVVSTATNTSKGWTGDLGSWSFPADPTQSGENRGAGDGRDPGDEYEEPVDSIEPGSDDHLMSLHQGCYGDAFNPRDLPAFLPLFAVTPRTCIAACHRLGYSYAGLQAGIECWCGSKFGRYGESDKCKDQCVFDDEFNCGGRLANRVYKTAAIPYASTLSIDERTDYPDSLIQCLTASTGERLCSIENLYYVARTKKFVVQIGPKSRVVGVSIRAGDMFESFVETNSVQFVHQMALTAVEDVGSLVDAQTVVRSSIPGRSFLLTRFLPYNIMHVLHDDLIGLYQTMAHHAPANYERDHGKPFPTDATIFLIDDQSAGSYARLLSAFSDHPVLHRSELDENVLLRFDWASVGLSRRSNWYQYGFFGPQGPIPNKPVSGAAVRQAADFIVRRLGIATDANPQTGTVVIFSRKGNRLILNEGDLKVALQQGRRKKVVLARLEDMPVKAIIELMTHADAAIGMHGSILILTMFMKPHAQVIEMFPFGVPPENYTPYKTLANLPGMDLKYDAWKNTSRNNTVGHPDRHRLQGGINHLNTEEQMRIVSLETVPPHKCCEDPVWLYKIYQDTSVDVEAISKLVQ